MDFSKASIPIEDADVAVDVRESKKKHSNHSMWIVLVDQQDHLLQ